MTAGEMACGTVCSRSGGDGQGQRFLRQSAVDQVGRVSRTSTLGPAPAPVACFPATCTSYATTEHGGSLKIAPNLEDSHAES
jgi:hypothetical protein